MSEIKAVKFTFLKKSTSQADELPDDEKVQVKSGERYQVTDYSEADRGHYHVTLGYDAGEWYIYSGHWKLPWGENGTDKEQGDNELNDKHCEELKPHDDPPTIDEIDWNNPDARVSEFFRVYEVTQSDPRRIPTDRSIMQNIVEHARELDDVRRKWKEYLKDQGKGDYSAAIAVTSFYRPPEVNREVGGATNSQHLTGSASDTRPVNGLVWEYQRWLDKRVWSDKALGYGAQLGFVHLDQRPNPFRWNY